jgi:hypothetical protein
MQPLPADAQPTHFNSLQIFHNKELRVISQLPTVMSTDTLQQQTGIDNARSHVSRLAAKLYCKAQFSDNEEIYNHASLILFIILILDIPIGMYMQNYIYICIYYIFIYWYTFYICNCKNRGSFSSYQNVRSLIFMVFCRRPDDGSFSRNR